MASVESVECQICAEPYDTEVHVPKRLLCMHIMCVVCARSVIRKGMMKCPFCNTQQKVANADYLPIDSVIIERIESMSGTKCDDCSKPGKVSECKLCPSRCCTSCLRLHKNRDHCNVLSHFKELDEMVNKETLKEAQAAKAQLEKEFPSSQRMQIEVERTYNQIIAKLTERRQATMEVVSEVGERKQRLNDFIGTGDFVESRKALLSKGGGNLQRMNEECQKKIALLKQHIAQKDLSPFTINFNSTEILDSISRFGIVRSTAVDGTCAVCSKTEPESTPAVDTNTISSPKQPEPCKTAGTCAGCLAKRPEPTQPAMTCAVCCHKQPEPSPPVGTCAVCPPKQTEPGQAAVAACSFCHATPTNAQQPEQTPPVPNPVVIEANAPKIPSRPVIAPKPGSKFPVTPNPPVNEAAPAPPISTPAVTEAIPVPPVPTPPVAQTAPAPPIPTPQVFEAAHAPLIPIPQVNGAPPAPPIPTPQVIGDAPVPPIPTPQVIGDAPAPPIPTPQVIGDAPAPLIPTPAVTAPAPAPPIPTPPVIGAAPAPPIPTSQVIQATPAPLIPTPAVIEAAPAPPIPTPPVSEAAHSPPVPTPPNSSVIEGGQLPEYDEVAPHESTGNVEYDEVAPHESTGNVEYDEVAPHESTGKVDSITGMIQRSLRRKATRKDHSQRNTEDNASSSRQTFWTVIKDIDVCPATGLLYIGDQTNRGHCQIHILDPSLDFFRAGGFKVIGVITALAVISEELVAMTDYDDHCVRIYSTSGDQIRMFGSEGDGNREFRDPCGIAHFNRRLFVADCDNDRICVWTVDGKLCSPIQHDELKMPVNVAINHQGDLFVGSTIQWQILVFSVDGHLKMTFSNAGRYDLPSVWLLCTDHDSNLYIVGRDRDNDEGVIDVFDVGYRHKARIQTEIDRSTETITGVGITNRGDIVLAATVGKKSSKLSLL